MIYGIINKLAVPVLLGTTFIDRFIKSVYPDKRRIILQHYPPAPIMMVHEAKSGAEQDKSDNRDETDDDLVLFETRTRGNNNNSLTSR